MYTDFTNVVRESLQLLMAFVFVRKSETGDVLGEIARAKSKLMDEIKKHEWIWFGDH